MRESKLSRKSQIVVPASVRKDLGLEPGDRVTFEPHPDGYLLRKAQDASWVDRLVAVGGDELRGYAEQLLRERHGDVDERCVGDSPNRASKAEPLVWLQRMEAFRGDHWNGAADELRRDREAWDLHT
jgi:AbrB family looped-hinge helix DNA binding protein